jgi:hypothetical protein
VHCITISCIRAFDFGKFRNPAACYLVVSRPVPCWQLQVKECLPFPPQRFLPRLNGVIACTGGLMTSPARELSEGPTAGFITKRLVPAMPANGCRNRMY